MENQSTINKEPTTWGKIKDWASTITFIVMLVACVYYGYQVFTGQQAFIMGYRGAVVLSGSMEPYMMTHSICLNKEITSPDQIEINDVITYKLDYTDGSTGLVTHRVIDIKDGLYYFKGDNNRVADGYGLPYEDLVSEVIMVSNSDVTISLINGVIWLTEQWNTDLTGKIICISAVVALICVYQLICLICSMIGSRLKRRDKGNNDDHDTPAQNITSDTASYNTIPASEENPNQTLNT